MNATVVVPEGKKEACSTYIEQTKLLVTLSSAFLLAPAGLVAVMKEKSSVGIARAELHGFITAEVLFVLSVLTGYVVLGTITGSQASGDFDVFRPATRIWSILQLVFYLGGLSSFVYLALSLAN